MIPDHLISRAEAKLAELRLSTRVSGGAIEPSSLSKVKENV